MGNVIVKMKLGDVKGEEKNGIGRWLGFPYAEPPVGEKRFKRTESIRPWTGVRDAIGFGSAPYQGVMEGMGSKKGLPVGESEDCLFMNVWSPGADDKKRPVMVWIYGGAFSMGDASTDMYDGEAMAKAGNVVFVSFNYRVGILGFYDFTGFPGSGDRFETNVGLHDQVLALRWVKENIASFGGDPDNITILGESAGASSVLALMACPASRGLFHKAIAQSPVADGAYSRSLAKESAAMALEKLGVGQDNLDALLTVPPEELGKVTGAMLKDMVPVRPGSFPAGPVVGDDLLSEVPMEAIRRGAAKGMPLIIGSNKDEGTLFIMKKAPMVPNSDELVHRMFRLNNPADEEKVLAAYSELKGKERIRELGKDINFHIQTVFTADYQSEHAPVWMYRFDFAGNIGKLMGFGALHGFDVGFALGNLNGVMCKTFLGLTSKKVAKNISERMQKAWISFARTGDPNNPGSSEWPGYDTGKRTTLVFDREDRLENDPSSRRREAWDGIFLYRREK